MLGCNMAPTRPGVLSWLMALFPMVLQGQWYSVNSDSIDLVLATTMDDRTRMRALDAMTGAWFMSDRALPYLKQGDVLSLGLLNHPDRALREEAMRFRATLLFNRGYHSKFHRDLVSAQRDFREAQALSSSLGDTMRMATSLDATGVTYLALDLPSGALQYFNREVDLLRDMIPSPPYDVARGLQHSAKALARMNRFVEAHAVLAQCDTMEPNYHALTRMVRAELHEAQGDLTKAKSEIERAYELVPKSPPNWNAITVLEPMAAFLLRAGEPQAALRTALECAELAHQIQDEAAWCGCRTIEGAALISLDDHVNARAALEASLDTAARWGYLGLSRETGDHGSMIHTAKLLIDLYKRSGETEAALNLTERWISWKDTVQALEARDAILRHDLQLAELNDSIAEAERMASATHEVKTELHSARNQSNLLIAFVVVALVGAGTFIWFYSLRRSRERIAAHFDMQRLKQEHMIRELRMREQVSTDLHEDLGAGLSALKLWIDMEAEEEPDSSIRQRYLVRSALANDLITSLRQIIWTLNSSATRLDQLIGYITDHAYLYCTQHRLALKMEDQHDVPALHLSTGQRRDIFLIVKAALHNVVQHAHATSVSIRIQWADGLHVTIHDDGTGMPHGPAGTTGNGIRTMQRRATTLGGTIAFDSSSGTCISLFVPIRNESSTTP